ncbi:MAG TPA: FUSC family protein, partial [Candidatus Nanopelagicales bacterium]|nr:FUSC family protein [Candidatus Nanopelagicales bacterium]
GALPATLAAVVVGPRRAWQIALASAASGTLAASFTGNAWLGALLIAALAGYAGRSARYGNQSPILFVPVVTSFIVISPPSLVDRAGQPIDDPAYAGIVGIALLIGGCWAALLGTALTRNFQRAGTESVSEQVATAYAIALALSTGLATFITAYFFPGSTGAWVILTILLVMKPRATDMWKTARHRVGGTLVGAVVAAAVILTLDGMSLPRLSWELGLGALFLTLALSVVQVRPYWQFVTLLTPAIILLKSSGQDELDLDAQRVLMTIIGTLTALVFAVGVREISNHRHSTVNTS